MFKYAIQLFVLGTARQTTAIKKCLFLEEYELVKNEIAFPARNDDYLRFISLS